MSNTNTINFVTGVTEDKTPIFYKPFFYGNQFFVVAQQNIQRIENIATFNFGLLSSTGEVVQLDPSQQNILFWIFMNHIEQYARSTNLLNLTPTIPVQTSCVPFSFPFFLLEKKDPCEKMDIEPFHFNYTRSTSSTELSSQRTRTPSRQLNDVCGNKNYVILDINKSDLHINDGIYIKVDDRIENCLKLNAREKLKLKKIRNDGSFA